MFSSGIQNPVKNLTRSSCETVASSTRPEHRVKLSLGNRPPISNQSSTLMSCLAVDRKHWRREARQPSQFSSCFHYVSYYQADRLGDDHDLSILSQHIADALDVVGSGQTVAVFQSLLDVRSHDLRRQSMTLGARLFGESTSEFVHRITTYWNETVESLAD